MVAQDPQGLRDFVPNIEEGGAAPNKGAPHKKGPSPEGSFFWPPSRVYARAPVDIGNEVTQPLKVLCDHCG